MPTVAERKAALIAQRDAELAALDAEAKQTEIEGLPRNMSDALAALQRAETIEKRAPHDYEAVIQAIIVCIRSVLNDLSQRPPAGKPHKHVTPGGPSVLAEDE